MARDFRNVDKVLPPSAWITTAGLRDHISLFVVIKEVWDTDEIVGMLN